MLLLFRISPCAFEATMNRSILLYSAQEFPTGYAAVALKHTILNLFCIFFFFFFPEAAKLTFALHQMKISPFLLKGDGLRTGVG